MYESYCNCTLADRSCSCLINGWPHLARVSDSLIHCKYNVLQLTVVDVTQLTCPALNKYYVLTFILLDVLFISNVIHIFSRSQQRQSLTDVSHIRFIVT